MEHLQASRRYRLVVTAAPITSLLPIGLKRWLAICHSDKESTTGHRYGATYHRILRPYKWRRTHLLEIGIGGYKRWAGGESLAAWRSYLPFGRIVGCDVEDKRVLARRQIEIRVLDQASASQLTELGADRGPFDVIIDDGSHINEHQILTFRTLWPHLRDGGVYVVEDVQTSYWPDMGGANVGQQGPSQAVGWFTRLTHYVNHCEFMEAGDPELTAIGAAVGAITFEHNLIIITKDGTPKRTNAPERSHT